MFREKHPSICRMCPYETHPFVPGEGPRDAELMIVGRDPGRTEEEELRPFVGDSGQVLNGALDAVGVDRSNVYVTNLLHCRPPGNNDKTKDWKEAAKRCQRYLQYEIARVKPKMVVALGDKAMRALVPKVAGSITGLRGSVFEINGHKVLPTYHPSYLLHNPAALPVLASDIAKAAALSAGGKAAEQEIKYTLVDSIEKFDRFHAELMRSPSVYLDVETTGLHWWKPENVIVCVSFTLSNGLTFVLPVRNYEIRPGKKRGQWELTTLPFWYSHDWDHVCKGLAVFFRSNIWKFLHNAKFDLHHLTNEGFDINLKSARCTMVLQHLLDENGPLDLKFLVALYAPEMSGYEREYRAKRLGPLPLDRGILYKYNAGDTIGTRLVRRAQWGLAKEEKLLGFYRNHSMPAMRLFFRAERRGVQIDRRRLIEVGRETIKAVSAAQRKCWDIHGEKFKVSSPPVLSRILFEERGLQPVSYSEKTEKPSTDKDSLIYLAETYGDELCKAVLEYRAFSKVLGTNIKGIIPLLDKNGRLHTNLSQTRTVTGRNSSSEPNLQNIQKEGPVKSFYVASKGHKLIVADLAQAELRVFAVLARDKAMLDAFARGEDPHDAVARMVFKTDNPDAMQRRVAKVVNFSVLFLKRPEDAARDCGMPEHEMVEHFNAFFERSPRIRALQKKLPRDAERKGYLVNAFGRRRRFNLRAAEESQGAMMHLHRQAVNFPPQSCASQINDAAAVRADLEFEKRGMGAGVILLVHDSIIVDCPEAEVPEATKIIGDELMRPVPELDNYSFPCEIGVGYSWLDAEKAQQPYIQ